jgi:hypothetical protein
LQKECSPALSLGVSSLTGKAIVEGRPVQKARGKGLEIAFVGVKPLLAFASQIVEHMFIP